MKRLVIFAVMLIGLISPFARLHAESGKIEEIRQYFELRDTISLVNLEMKRAMAQDSRSPMLYEKNAEQTLTSLMQFVESRIQQFAQSNTSLKYHYVKKLNALFNETRQLYGAVVVKMRTKLASDKPGSLITQNETAKSAASASLKLQPRPYFHPIDLRTLLSPALLNANKIKIDQPPVVQPRSEVASAAAVVQVKPGDSAAVDPAVVSVKPPLASVTVNVAEVKTPVKPEELEKPIKQIEPAAIASAVIALPPSAQATPASITPSVGVTRLPETVKKPEPVQKPEPAKTTGKAIVRAEVIKPAAVAPAGEGFMRPLAVMIENHNKSRPQTGLDQADMVYEMPVEGGITRFMAVYNKLPENLGPVRSCREYFIDRALELDALYVHCGASPVGYAYISKSGINSIDEIKHSPPFYRDNSRKAPHNLYGKGAGLYNYMAERVPMRLKEKPALFKKVGPIVPLPEAGQSVKIKYHGNYTLEIKYEEGAYQRYMNNVLHVDRISEKPLRSPTVIVQVASMKTVDAAGRQEISFIGSGTAWIMDRGQMTRVVWHKATPRSLTSYLDNSGNEYAFSGELPVWVQVVSPVHKISFNGEAEAAGVAAGAADKKNASDTETIGKQG